MANGTITGVHVCGGGGHVTLRLTVGAQSFDFSYDSDEIVNALAPEERRGACLTIARFHCTGMTKQQAWAELQAGIDVSTS